MIRSPALETKTYSSTALCCVEKYSSFTEKTLFSVRWFCSKVLFALYEKKVVEEKV